jgi:hypothetical protein
LPVVTSADALSDLMDQTRFTLSRIAASQVDYDLSRPSCVVMTSASTVHVGEKYLFAWGSSGTLDTVSGENIWTPNGAFIVAISTPGIRTYTLDFYGVGGAKTSCTTRVIVK